MHQISYNIYYFNKKHYSDCTGSDPSGSRSSVGDGGGCSNEDLAGHCLGDLMRCQVRECQLPLIQKINQ